MKISIIGAGRIGGALALAFSRKNHVIENIFVRRAETVDKIRRLFESPLNVSTTEDFSSISSDVIVIATQDSEIETVAARLAEKISTKPFVFHTSGALSSEILEKLKNIGCPVGSIHPLISISDARIGADKFADAYFCVEGGEAAVKIAERLVESLDGAAFAVPTEFKALYHAAAVTACGHLVALIDAAIEMLTVCGLSANDGQKILLPLIKSTVENLETQSPSGALTGTFARADVETLERHLRILRENVAADLLKIYLTLGERSLDLAAFRGANNARLEKMRGQIMLAKKNLK